MTPKTTSEALDRARKAVYGRYGADEAEINVGIICELIALAQSAIHPPGDQPATAGAEASLRDQLQKRCVDWNAYWRASDAHGVELTKAQAVELLCDALGVEVEIADSAKPAGEQPEPHRDYAAGFETRCRRLLALARSSNPLDGKAITARDLARLCEIALASAPAPSAKPAGEPYGWLYDWTHSSALGKPDEKYTGFTEDEAHARKHDNVRAVYIAAAPAPAEPAAPVLPTSDGRDQ